LLADAFIAAAFGRHADALRHTRGVLGYTEAVGMAQNDRAWPLAIRSAFLIGDTTAVEELLAMLEGYPVGHLPPILRAERTLARARLQIVRGDADADDGLAAAIVELRAVASPYHLAHALLDRAEHLNGLGESIDADALIDEAYTIAAKLRAQPLLDRATETRAIASPRPTTPAPASA
jgi:hypothetical protein